MSSRKFHTLLLLWMMLFTAFCAGGCSSSGGGVYTPSEPMPTTPQPVVSQDPVPTPSPTPIVSPDPIPAPAPAPTPTPAPETSADEYALNEIVIGYANGDNPKYVTRNLTLPTKIRSVDISWSSSSEAVSASGIVTRQAEDVDVTLTASASYNGQSAGSRTFAVKVIRKRTRNNSSIIAVPLEEASSGDIEITRNESGDVTDIEGQYVSFDIRNGDDALDAVTVLREELGVRSPDKELEIEFVNFRSSGRSYSFGQVHNGVQVHGRGITVSTNLSGEGNFLRSNILSSDLVEKAVSKADIGQSSAETAAKNNYSGDVSVDKEVTEKIIYSFGDYEAEPVYAYIVRVYGTTDDGYIDNSVFVSAVDGTVIASVSNMLSANDSNVSTSNGYGIGTTEFGDEVTFPVTVVSNGSESHYYMRRSELQAAMYYDEGNFKFSAIYSDNNEFTDTQAVTAYRNTLLIMQWWREEPFSRNSIDNKGAICFVVAHSKGDFDNAAWSSLNQNILIYDPKDLDYSVSSAADVMAHETTHAVMQYTAGLTSENFINEGYADIFACIYDGNWTIGEDVYEHCLRNIADPDDPDARQQGPSKFSEIEKYENIITYDPETGKKRESAKRISTEAHILSFLVSHTAYLMHEDSGVADGLTWNELAKVWYNSMSCGLLHGIIGGYFSSREELYANVHSCVVKAAKELVANGELQQSKLAVIEEAFNSVGIIDTSANTANFSGKVTNAATGRPLSGYKVSVYSKPSANATPSVFSAQAASDTRSESYLSRLIQKVRTFLTEYFTMKLSKGTYTVSFSKEGYQPYTAEVSIGTADVELNVSLSLSADVSEDILIDEAHFPDDQFREYVKRFDTNSDGILSHQEIEGVTYIDFGNTTYSLYYPVGSLKGIEHFIYLTYLNCTGTIITSIDNELDLSRNTALETLYCAGNNLVSLNVSSCSALQSLQCSTNALTSLDISNCTALQYLECEANNLTELDVRNNTALLKLNCWANGLTSLDVSQNTVLQSLNCGGNQLTQLDVRNCVALVWLECQHNLLKKINASGCSNLELLRCQAQYENSLELLDISGCAALYDFLYDHNKSLKILNMSGCISLTRLDFSNQYYTDPKFQLVSLDVSGCIGLTELICYNNQLVSLNVNGCTALQTLACQDNQLTELDVSGCTALQSLSCENNQLTTLDLSNCPELNSENVGCDEGVTIIWPSSTSSAASTLKSDSASTILAVLPAFTPSVSGIYTFTVSLDRTPPEGSTLLLLADSEDLNGSFALADSPDTVTVSADFTAGRTYTAVIAAESESGSLNGGCNAGTVSIILFAGLLFAGKKTKR